MLQMTMMQGLGSIGLFSSRAFLPALATAVALRYGHEIPFLGSSDFFSDLPDAPTWFTHNYTIAILTLLSAVELAGNKVPEARQMLEEVDQYVKPGMAALTYLGFMNAVDTDFVEQTIQQAGFVESFILLPLIAGVFYLSSVRNQVMSLFTQADEDDELGVQGLLSWAEDLWSSFGVFVLLAYPPIMLTLIAIVSGFFILLRKYAEYREEKSKIACTSCGEMIYPSAIACQKCATKNPQPHKVGFFGGSKSQQATNLETHSYRLIEKKRCPVCASRFENRDPKQTCSACDHHLMADGDFAKKYMDNVGKRLPGVLLISFLFSLIPVVGLIPGVIYYRMALVAPFKRYIPLTKGLVLKIFIKIIFIILIVVQIIPGVGGAAVPIMALISYVTYRSSYEKLLTAEVAAA